MTDTLIVFAREPVRGSVKKRLANDIGDTGALAVYKRLLERTLRLARGYCRRNSETRLVVCGHKLRSGARLSQFCANTGASLQEQQGEDLGDRMLNALHRARLEGSHRTVLIGTDCPSFTQADLRSAFAALSDAPVVIAPTTDGGYSLVGVTGHYPALFEQMPWGSDQVAIQTIERAQIDNIQVQRIREQADIDYHQDWKYWQKGRAQISLAEHPWDQ